MEISFHNKRILVTGAGQGIGRCLAKKLAECHAEVVAISRTAKYLDTLKEEVPQITTIAVDVTDTENATKLIKEHGPYHGLVNNAAIAELQPFFEVTPDSFDRLFNVNVKAPILISQVVAKTMIDNNIEGSIVNLSSQASLIALRDHTVYCGTKGALDIISKVMALELGNHQIRVNCVNPTVVLTDMGKLGWSDPKKAEPMLNRIPLHRFAEVDDVVNAIIFLLSDSSKMINGVVLPIDGGATAN
ncbi:unnamed protein product [Nezara viridula]|uniref:L-xylulose reductase n=1 Tax=Nezara viridula TaxID=85310 RepID=A0A9P0H0Y2_NEZVI|nr:unnamed protein product [Nezara viridula]